MPSYDDLVHGVKAVMIKVWRLPPQTSEAEIEKYASLIVDRINVGDTRYALDLQARDIQVNWLKLPPTKDYSEVVDWALAMVRRACEA
jgi:hypothetical protein